MSRRQQIEDLYRAFNARDIDVVLASMSSEVRWPNGWEGGWLSGKEQVRRYWLRQWREIDPTVEPQSVDELPDGSVRVRVRQVVKRLDGTPLTEAEVVHVYRFEGSEVVAMSIVDA